MVTKVLLLVDNLIDLPKRVEIFSFIKLHFSKILPLHDEFPFDDPSKASSEKSPPFLKIRFTELTDGIVLGSHIL